MIWNKHSNFEGQHATLSASKPHWLRYTDERMFEYVDNLHAARRGTQLHAFASMAIMLGQKMPDNSKTLNAYVNDAIGFRMSPEQLLFYSPRAFGTADAIGFHNKVLRIHDLKTGTSKASEDQLKIYTALFCLEYGIRPSEIQIELRFYQHDTVIEFDTDPQEIVYIMDRIVELDKLIAQRMEEEV